MKRTIICIIQARFNSIRLPGKVLMNLAGKSVLERVVERVKKSGLIDDVVVATTIRKEDLRIVKLCKKLGVRVFCGSEADVLDRYFQAAKLLNATDIVRITADCPLIDHRIIDKVIGAHVFYKADYTSNTIDPTFPDGQDVEVFTFHALLVARRRARLMSDREHVTPFIKKNPSLFKLVNVECKKDLSDKRWTLDEKEDYKLIGLIYKYLLKTNNNFAMKDILKLISEHPELEKINSGIQRNEGYLKSLKNDRLILKR